MKVPSVNYNIMVLQAHFTYIVFKFCAYVEKYLIFTSIMIAHTIYKHFYT